MKKITPKEALEDAITFGLFSMRRMVKVPGEVVKRMGKRGREILSHLKSDDIAPDKFQDDYPFYDESFEQRKKLSEELRKFDRKMNKNRK